MERRTRKSVWLMLFCCALQWRSHEATTPDNNMGTAAYGSAGIKANSLAISITDIVYKKLISQAAINSASNANSLGTVSV